MTIQSAFSSDRSCFALTGISVAAFQNLIPAFSRNLMEACITRNPKRQRAFGGGRTGLLPTPAHKLFALLSFLLRLDRTRCFRWIQFLLPVLAKTLGRKLVLPKRQIHSVEEFFREFPEAKDIFIDGDRTTGSKTREPEEKKTTLLRKKESHHTKNNRGI